MYGCPRCICSGGSHIRCVYRLLTFSISHSSSHFLCCIVIQLRSAKPGFCHTVHHVESNTFSYYSYSAFLPVCLCSMNLTWRDMQHLVVRTSQPGHLSSGDWKTNGVGRRGTGCLVQIKHRWYHTPLYLCLNPEHTVGHFEHRKRFFVSTRIVFCRQCIIMRRIV